MAFRLDRAAVADLVRVSPGFGSLTRRIRSAAETEAKHIAAARTHRRTGVYEGGFESTFTPVAQTAVLGRLRLFNTVAYAQIIEGGSRPHVIRIRNAAVLFSHDTGKFFGTKVNHPGTQPQHVIRDALLRVAARTIA